jgi:Fe2+ transport system protein FeoA
MRRLDQLLRGQSATVTAIAQCGAIGQRLMALGLLPGTRVRLTRVAPLGDPIAVRLDGCELSLRRAEAAALTVNDIA